MRMAICLLKEIVLNESLLNGPSPPTWHGTTIVTVRKGGKVVIAGDGQVSLGQTVIKHNAKKVRPLGKGHVIARKGIPCIAIPFNTEHGPFEVNVGLKEG